ncbi:MAG TPA: LysR substrate-binding domain-containing protein [Burkholderiales bacterium]
MTPSAPRAPGQARLPSLDSLKVFEAAARHLSFTQAAAELAVTQSAVSRQIKTVEEALGISLFTRYNRRLELTEAGLRLSRGTARALSDLEAAVQEISGGETRVVTVTTPLSFASLWLVPRLAAFRDRHPEIDLRLAANDAIVSLERERIDCAIRFCEPGEAPAGAIALMGEEVFPVASPKLLRDRARPLKTPADLKRHVLLRWDDPNHRLPWLGWPVWLSTWKLENFAPAGWLTFSHYDQLIAAAVEGEGVAIGRQALVARLLRQKKLVIPFGERVAAARQYFVILSRASRARPELRAFVEWVQAEAAQEAGSA